MKQLLLGIVNKFILPEAVHSASGIADVDLSIANQKSDEELMLGTMTHVYLVEIEDDVLGTSQLTDFYSHVCQFLTGLVQSGVKRLPLQDQVLNDLTWLDPRE